MAKKEFTLQDLKDEAVHMLYHRREKDDVVKHIIKKYDVKDKEELETLIGKIEKEVTKFRFNMGKVN